MDIEKINEITMESFSRISNLHGHIGFDSLPYQVVNQAVRNGFLFNILCIGETGLGKSTLMDALFNTDFESKPSLHNSEGVTLKTNTYQLKEGNVNLKLTIVDTVGYGDQINKSNSFDDIANYIDAQFENYLQEELKAKRSLLTYQDTRIHVCLYFICPTGHGLKAIDLVCMQKLDKKVNIIPIIAKADTISSTDLPAFKAKILNELIRYGINIYRFPTNDASVSNSNSKMNDLIPFAIVGSTDFLQVGNKKVRCRKYPWGILEVENEAHSDFVKLREMLIRTNMEDMRDRTHDCYYELYRKERLEQLGFTDVECDSKKVKYKENCELKRAAYFEKLHRKEENMRKNFVNKVRDAEAELKQAEKELYDKFEKLKRGYTDEQKKLDEGRRQLDEDIQEFYRLKARVTTKNHQSNYTLTLGRSKKK